ncbi:MAG: PAS domain S-box protein [Desulfobacteraceae bacterium]|nr:PAS domain S-box protein [Desulfobacteraceae bacterium]
MNIRKAIFFFSFLASLLTLLGGYFYFSAILKQAIYIEHDKAREYIKVLKSTFPISVDGFQKEVKLLADHKMIQGAFVVNDSKALFSANTTLDYFKRALEADVCYLIDLHGNTIASSNRNTAENFVGNNYGFRQYFKEAIQEHSFVSLALGTTSKKRGIYCSQPVYENNKKPVIGVAVIKRSIKFLPIENADVEQSILILIDQDGVIFDSNHQDWLYKVLWKPLPAVLNRIKQNHQFGLGPWAWTGMVQQDKEYAIDAEGNSFFLHQEGIDSLPGWKLIYLQNMQDVLKAIYNAQFKAICGLIVILIILSGALIVFLCKKANQDLCKREEAQEALLESEQRFRCLSEASFEGIVITEDGLILETNELYAKMHGYVPHELLGKNVLELVALESRDDITNKVKSRWKSSYEILGLKKDGSSFVAEVHGKIIPYKGQSKRVTTIRDITSRKLAEQEKEKLIAELKDALSKLETLSGLVPICANCKKIRDDKGYWNNLESYIEEHSKALFSHSICHECQEALYGDQDWYIEMKKTKK